MFNAINPHQQTAKIYISLGQTLPSLIYIVLKILCALYFPIENIALKYIPSVYENVHIQVICIC